MIFFGHLGITLGTVKVVDSAFINKGIGRGVGSGRINSGFVDTVRTVGKIDYRYVLLGAMLPDIIDKAILFVYNNDTVRSGRYIAHSLFFMLTLFILGMIMKALTKNWGVIILSICSCIHLILDYMWNQMNTLLWPFWSLLPKTIAKPTTAWMPFLPAIPKGGELHFSIHAAKNFLLKPAVIIPETIGAIIFIYFLFSLLRKRKLKSFLTDGMW